MQLAHTADDGLAALLVGADSEGGVFLCQLGEAIAELVEVFLRLGLHSDTDYGIGEVHALEHDGCVFIAESVTGANILEAYACADITCRDAVHGVLVVTVHLEETAHALLLPAAGIVDIAAGFDLTGIHAEEGQASHIRVGSNLEGKGRGLLVLRGLAILFVTGVRTHANHIRGVQRTGQESTNVVEQRLHTLVLEGGATEHRSNLHAHRGSPQSCENLSISDTAGVVEELLHESLVVLSGGLNHLVAPLLSLVDHVGGNLLNAVLSAHRLAMPEDSLHLNEVHDALEVLFSADGDDHGHSLGAQHILHLANDLKEVGATAIHLVYISDTGDVVLVCLAPHGLRLGLHATNCAVGCHSTVEHTQ